MEDKAKVASKEAKIIPTPVVEKKLPELTIPGIKELLKAGVQFGHETKRWNPKMAQFIFGAKNNIHIMDITQTAEKLEIATKQLQKLAAQGDILFVATKRQASTIAQKYAIESGSYFITQRWVGGFFTNFAQVKNSTRKLREYEQQFETGVEGRTKYEVARMKVEWQRLNRLYQGVKTMDKWPVAVIVIDPRYERGAVKECKQVGIPVFALADSNCDPEMVDYIVPGNDDALGAIELVLKTFTDAIKSVKPKGVVHSLKDFSKIDIKVVKKTEQAVQEITEAEVPTEAAPARTEIKAAEGVAKEAKKPVKRAAKPKQKTSGEELEGGILGRSRSQKTKK